MQNSLILICLKKIHFGKVLFETVYNETAANRGFQSAVLLAIRGMEHTHRVARHSLVHTEQREDLSRDFGSVTVCVCLRCMLLKLELI